MRFAEARSMLGSAFGPGDLNEKVNELTGAENTKYEFTFDDANKLMDWIAQQLTDEDEDATEETKG